MSQGFPVYNLEDVIVFESVGYGFERATNRWMRSYDAIIPHDANLQSRRAIARLRQEILVYSPRNGD